MPNHGGYWEFPSSQAPWSEISEFRYRDPKIDPGTLVIPVSQSGETADTDGIVTASEAGRYKISAYVSAQNTDNVDRYTGEISVFIR